MANNNINTPTNKLGPLGQSEAASDRYSVGRVFHLSPATYHL